MPKLKRVAEKRVITEKQKNISNAGRALAYVKWDNDKKRPDYLLQLEKAREQKEVYKKERKVEAKKKRKKQKAKNRKAQEWVDNIEKEQIKKIKEKKKEQELAKMKVKKKAKPKTKKRPQVLDIF